MKFYSDAKNQIVVKYGKIIAQFVDGEFETQELETIEILIEGGYKHGQEDQEIPVEKIGRDAENNNAGQGGEKRVHQTEKVKKSKGKPKKGD